MAPTGALEEHADGGAQRDVGASTDARVGGAAEELEELEELIDAASKLR